MSLAELKKLVGNKKLIVGTDRTLKLLKKGELKEIFVSVNCPKNDKDTLTTQAKMFSVKVDQLEISNDDLGVVVKKPFSVSVVALQK